MGRWAEDRQRFGGRRGQDDECLLKSSARARIRLTCLERLGRRSSQYAIPDRSRGRIDACTGFPAAIEVGVRIPRRHGALFANGYDGRLYVSSNAGYVYSLDAGSGCMHWAFRAQAAVRSSFTIGRLSRSNARLAVLFGDVRGTAYALDASTGAVIWKTLTDSHPLARITGTPALNDGRVYVPVGSLEEPGGWTGELCVLHFPRICRRA